MNLRTKRLTLGVVALVAAAAVLAFAASAAAQDRQPPPTDSPPPQHPAPPEQPALPQNQDKPCRCDWVTGTIRGVNFGAREPKGPSIIGFAIDWEMWCPGVGKGCAGEVKIVPPKGSDLKPILSSATAISCKGPCDAVTSGKGNISFRSENTLDNRASRGFTFRVLEICVNDGNKEVVGATEIKVFFGPRGLLDRRRSDLDGDGQPDGS